jgi:RND superfamily putative drug exporter
MLLVPATMELLGDRNWWLPRWLDRILPRLNVEGPADETHAGVVEPQPGLGLEAGPAGNGDKPETPSEEPVGSR